MAAKDVEMETEAEPTRQATGGWGVDGSGTGGSVLGYEAGVCSHRDDTEGGGMADPGARAQGSSEVAGGFGGGGGLMCGSSALPTEAAGVKSVTGPVAGQQVSPAVSRTDAEMVNEKIDLVSDVRELWVMKCTAGFPRAAADATAAVATIVDREWLMRKRTRGPAVALTYSMRNGPNDKIKAFSTGMVEVIRDRFDGWQVESLPVIEAAAWRVWCGIEHCMAVKSFGKASNFAREINWLYKTVAEFLEEGNALSLRASEVAIGYLELRANQALESGDGWNAGPMYGINLTLDEVEQVVRWATAKHKEGGNKGEGLELRWDGVKVVSTTDETCVFKSAQTLVGSVTTFVQSKLGLRDFEVDNSEGAPGLALIRKKFGEEYVCKVIPSCPRGMADKGIVKVRILCELRFEKWLRSVQSKLVLLSEEEDGGIPPMIIGDTKYKVKFLSLQSASEIVEAGENARGGGGRAVLENSLRNLQAENAKAAAKLAEVLEQIEGLADAQKVAQEHTAKNLSEMAMAQRAASEDAQAKIAAVAADSQARLRDLAANQAQAHEDTVLLIAESTKSTQRRIAESSEEAFRYSREVHSRTQENVDKLATLLANFVVGQSEVARIQGRAVQPCLDVHPNKDRFVLATRTGLLAGMVDTRVGGGSLVPCLGIMNSIEQHADGVRALPGQQQRITDGLMMLYPGQCMHESESGQCHAKLIAEALRGDKTAHFLGRSECSLGGHGWGRNCHGVRVKGDGGGDVPGFRCPVHSKCDRPAVNKGFRSKQSHGTVFGAGGLEGKNSLRWGVVLLLLSSGDACLSGSVADIELNWNPAGGVTKQRPAAESGGVHTRVGWGDVVEDLLRWRWPGEVGRCQEFAYRLECDAGRYEQIDQAAHRTTVAQLVVEERTSIAAVQCGSQLQGGAVRSGLGPLTEVDLDYRSGARGFHAALRRSCGEMQTGAPTATRCRRRQEGTHVVKGCEDWGCRLVHAICSGLTQHSVACAGSIAYRRRFRRQTGVASQECVGRSRGRESFLVASMAKSTRRFLTERCRVCTQKVQITWAVAHVNEDQRQRWWSSTGIVGWWKDTGSCGIGRDDAGCEGVRSEFKRGGVSFLAGGTRVAGGPGGEMRSGTTLITTHGDFTSGATLRRVSQKCFVGESGTGSFLSRMEDVLGGVFERCRVARGTGDADVKERRGGACKACCEFAARVGPVFCPAPSASRAQSQGGADERTHEGGDAHRKQILQTCGGGSTSEGWSSDLVSLRARLGIDYGSWSNSVASNQEGTPRGSRGIRQSNDGSSCSHGGGSTSSLGSRCQREAVGGRVVFEQAHLLRLAVLGCGLGRRGSHGHLWRTLDVLLGFGGCRVGAYGVAGGMGLQIAVLHGRLATPVDERAVNGGRSRGRCSLFQLALRTMVGGVDRGRLLRKKTKDASFGSQGDLCYAGGCCRRTSQSHHNGMRGQHFEQAFRIAVAPDSRPDFPASRLEVVKADHLPKAGAGQLLAKEALMDRWGAEAAGLCRGGLLLAGAALGLFYCKGKGRMRATRWSAEGMEGSGLVVWVNAPNCRAPESASCRKGWARNAGCCQRQGGSGISDAGNMSCSGRGDTSAGAAPSQGAEYEANSTDMDDGGSSSGAGGPAFGAVAAPARTYVGRVLFWNARQLSAPLYVDADAGASASSAAQLKLEFLSQQLQFFDPWVVAFVEVSGCRKRLVALRHWFKKRGYGLIFQVGEGSSKRQEAQTGIPTNGLVVAYRQGLRLTAAKRLSFRALAVSLRHEASAAMLNLVILHGASGELGIGPQSLENESKSFTKQLDECATWCQEHDGVLLADMNRVPCLKWRESGTSSCSKLSVGDKALRRLTDWRCCCCREGSSPASDAHGNFIGEQLDASGRPRWTRWGNGGKARLDVGIAFGDSRHSWREFKVAEPWLATDGGLVRVSDHAVIAFNVHLHSKEGVLRGEARPLPVNLGPRPLASDDAHSPWTQMRLITEEQTFRVRWRQAILSAQREGASQVEVLTPMLRQAGEQAVHRARRDGKAGKCDGKRAPGRDLHSEVRSWEERFRVASAGAEGAELSNEEWLTLFHPKTRLRGTCIDTRLALGNCHDWSPIIARCQKRMRRARAALLTIQRRRDRSLAVQCAQIDAQLQGGEPYTHVRKVWRLLCERKRSTKIQELYRGDVKGAPRLNCDDPEFLLEAGRIGEAFVDAMDKGSVAQAFKAWLFTFSGRPRGAIGREGEWSVRSDFTYAAYEKILKAMSGKAVGAGGLSVELLLAASEEVRRLFYEAILADVERGCLARHWKRILYVLLPKPAPNDPAIIAQRREIALEPQDLKVLLQGLRWSAYGKVGDRLLPEQYGWRGGASCIEPSLALGCALNQARRLKHELWVLYIDLANFFPAINREIACASELHLGLPERVADIMGAIYGGQRGFQEPMECQYETAAGLGAPFKNHMGRLMGCPVSPDSAKILLDSVLRAIKRSVRGLQLWPFEGAELTQIAFADDWCGVFVDPGELRKALTIWNTWVQVVGAALGIKGLVKTVVSGVEYSHGRAMSPPDPGLKDADGTAIPFLPCDKFYKHLGIPRSCDSMGSKAWVGGNGVIGIRDKLRAGLRRLRRVRQGNMSIDDFMMVSNVLLGCTAGFYLSTWVASEDELEQIEREWRKIFNKFACRDVDDPVVDLYGPAPRWTKGRTHLRSVGTAALFSAMEKAMSDGGSSPAGVAVRSTVALALYQHGCRSEPNRWNWAHLREVLASCMRGQGSRFLGDAWMLAALEVEEGKEPGLRMRDRDEEMRTDVAGRWKGLTGVLGATDNPLRADAKWAQQGSVPMFSPVHAGGLGLQPCKELLEAGVHELHDLCTRPWRGTSAEGRWLLDKKEAERRFNTRITKRWWSKWVDTQQTLARGGLKPVFSTAAGLHLRRYPGRLVTGEKRAVRRVGLRSSGERWRGLVRGLRQAKMEADDHVPAEVWERRLQAAFPTLERADEDEERDRASMVRRVDSTLVVWSLLKNGDEEIPQCGTFTPWESPIALAVDWQSEALALKESVKFRKTDGWPVTGDLWTELGEEQIAALPPGPRLAVRARLGLGRSVEVRERGFGEKLKGVRVALDVQEKGWSKMCEIQARFQFTHAFSGDSSWGDAVDEEGRSRRDRWGWPIRVVSAVTVSDQGEVFGGCLREDLPYSNYSGEIVALIAALRETPEGSRVLLCFDASSPVAAWAKFRRAHARTQRGYHEVELLSELDALLQRMEVVYFWWFSSHCGAPVNEWPDIIAEQMRISNQELSWCPGASTRCFEMWPARVTGPIFRWAVRACNEAFRKRASSALGARPVREESDWVVGQLPETLGIVADWIRQDKLMVGDAGHKEGRRVRRLFAGSCAYGCEGGASNWRHYLFHCKSPALRDARRSVCEWIDGHRRSFDCLGLHKQIAALRSRLAERKNSEPRDRTTEWDEAARRVFCGFLRRDACDIGSTVAIARANVYELFCRCGAVATAAISLEEPLRLHVTQEIKRHSQLRKAMQWWCKLYLHAGPLRVAALRQVRAARVMASWAARWGPGMGRLTRCSAVVLRVKSRQLCSEAVQEAQRRWAGVGKEAALVLWFLAMRLWGRLVRRKTSAEICYDRAMTEVVPQIFRRVLRWFPELEGQSLGKDDRVWTPSALEGSDDVEGLALSGYASRHKWACRAFYRLGGFPKLRATLKLLRKEGVLAQKSQLSRWLLSWSTSGTCSGAPPLKFSESDRIAIHLLPRQRKRARQSEIEEDMGRKADKQGRWAVEQLLRARRRLGLWKRNGGPCGWEFLVQWKGAAEVTWEPFTAFSQALRVEAKELIRQESRHALARAAERTRVARKGRKPRMLQDDDGDATISGAACRCSKRLQEATARKRKLESALVVYRPQKRPGGSRSRTSGFHEVKELSDRRIINGEPYVRVRWKHPAPDDPEFIHFAWLSEDLQDALLAAPRGESVVVEDDA